MKVTVHITPSEYRRLSDEELIRRFSELHETAPVYHLFERYGHLILGVCLKYAENANGARKLTEDVFVKMLGDSDDYRATANFKSWLFHYLENYGLADAHARLEIPAGFTAAHEKKIMEDALAQLPPEQKIVVELYEKDKNYDTVAKATGYPIQRIKNLLNIGWQRIKTYYQTHTFRHS